MHAAHLWMAGTILGLIVSFAAIFKLVVIGYYPNEHLPALLAAIIGLVIAVPCHVMYRRARDEQR